MSTKKPPGATPGCDARSPGRNWVCTYHLDLAGETLHVASATDTFCAAWLDSGPFMDFVASHNGQRDIYTWDTALAMMEGTPLCPVPTDEEINDAAERLAAMLESMEQTAGSGERE